MGAPEKRGNHAAQKSTQARIFGSRFRSGSIIAYTGTTCWSVNFASTSISSPRRVLTFRASQGLRHEVK